MLAASIAVNQPWLAIIWDPARWSQSAGVTPASPCAREGGGTARATAGGVFMAEQPPADGRHRRVGAAAVGVRFETTLPGRPAPPPMPQAACGAGRRYGWRYARSLTRVPTTGPSRGVGD